MKNLIIFSTLFLSSCTSFDISEWSVKQGVTYHPEKLSWRKAASVCKKNNGHLITVDCGVKEKHVREYLREIKKTGENVWIGLNSVDQYWKWDSSDSSVNSYRNFHNGQFPELNTCVLMLRLV